MSFGEFMRPKNTEELDAIARADRLRQDSLIKAAMSNTVTVSVAGDNGEVVPTITPETMLQLTVDVAIEDITSGLEDMPRWRRPQL